MSFVVKSNTGGFGSPAVGVNVPRALGRTVSPRRGGRNAKLTQYFIEEGSVPSLRPRRPSLSGFFVLLLVVASVDLDPESA